jgi:CRISPR type III-B/RAMP module-associated protein Cmr5
MGKTLEQQRAAFALDKVEAVKDREDKAKYKTQLLKLPARLHSNGLGQTVAFYLSAGSDKPEAKICEWLEKWLNRPGGTYESGRLIDNLTGRGVPDEEAESKYREASVEARALAVWLKRFAEAFIAGEAEEP